MKLSIVIPCFNEAPTIHLILDKVLSIKLIDDIEKEIILVNDASTDKTHSVIKKMLNLLIQLEMILPLEFGLMERSTGKLLGRKINL